MDFWSIVKNVGSAALQVALPGTGSIIVGALNKMLPADKQLPENATGSDAQDALVHIPEAQRAELMGRQFDVTIEQLRQSGESNRVMLLSEASSKHTTRPKIAMGAFRVVSFITILIVSMWSYAILQDDPELVKAIVDGWPFVGMLIFPFVGWLNSYFGILKAEQRDKLNAAQGAPAQSGIVGLVSALLKR